MGKNAEIDNSWVGVALAAVHKENKDLARVLGIHPSGVTRILKNKRALKDFETSKIKDWLRSLNYNVPQLAHKEVESSVLSAPNIPLAEGKLPNKEGQAMSDSTLMKFIEMLIDDVKDLKKEVRELRGRPDQEVKPRRRRSRP